ncbi:UNVERIFIED_CONTAM: putative acetyltransferase [Acetivibrio alkalicellulosi]
MNKLSIISRVQKQLAIEWKCDFNAFLEDENVFIMSENDFFEIVTFGKNAVFKAHPSIYNWCKESFSVTSAKDIMDGDNLYAIETKLREYGKKLAGEHIRYLYLNMNAAVRKPVNFQYRLFDKDNIKNLYINKGFSNALNYENDVIALGAYEGNQLIALAGADDIMSSLLQIGIDTLPQYRNRGLGCYLVKTLADEIVRRGLIPYYTTWSSNIASTIVAIKAGFLPMWVGYFAIDV